MGSRGDLGHLLDGRTGDRVAFLGPRPQAELAAELRRAEFLVLPSRNDSYGMVVAEALASGTPVLVWEMVGSKDLVTEGEDGLDRPRGGRGRPRRPGWLSCVRRP